MKRSFLGLLLCPCCCGGGFDLAVWDETGTEVISGRLQCRNCRIVFQVKDGIINSFYNRDPIVEKEIEGNRAMVAAERAALDDEWLLALPESYAQVYGDKNERWQNEEAEVRKLIDVIGPRPGDLVLDLGAGTTWSTNVLALRGCLAVGVDVSTEKYVGLSSSSVFMNDSGSYYERIQADMASRLPFPRRTVDAIFCFSSIHHSSRIQETFREVARLLKPGGKLGLVEATRGWAEPSNLFGRREILQWGINEHKYSLGQYREFARQAGVEFHILPAPSFFSKMDMLAKKNFKPLGPIYFKHKLARLIARTLWRWPAFRSLAVAIYPLLCHILGMQILAIASSRNWQEKPLKNLEIKA